MMFIKFCVQPSLMPIFTISNPSALIMQQEAACMLSETWLGMWILTVIQSSDGIANSCTIDGMFWCNFPDLVYTDTNESSWPKYNIHPFKNTLKPPTHWWAQVFPEKAQDVVRTLLVTMEKQPTRTQNKSDEYVIPGSSQFQFPPTLPKKNSTIKVSKFPTLGNLFFGFDLYTTNFPRSKQKKTPATWRLRICKW